jgi:hypothetical protein
MISSTSAPDGLHQRLAGAGGGRAFNVADNLLNGPIAGVGLDLVRSHGQTHYLFAGTVDARARQVTVTLGGERRDARLTESSLTRPVHVPADGLTREGRRRAARMPDKVSIRVYAAGFTPNLLAGQHIVVATLDVTLDDGTHTTMKSARFCVSRRCGVRPAGVG